MEIKTFIIEIAKTCGKRVLAIKPFVHEMNGSVKDFGYNQFFVGQANVDADLDYYFSLGSEGGSYLPLQKIISAGSFGKVVKDVTLNNFYLFNGADIIKMSEYFVEDTAFVLDPLIVFLSTDILDIKCVDGDGLYILHKGDGIAVEYKVFKVDLATGALLNTYVCELQALSGGVIWNNSVLVNELGAGAFRKYDFVAGVRDNAFEANVNAAFVGVPQVLTQYITRGFEGGNYLRGMLTPLLYDLGDASKIKRVTAVGLIDAVFTAIPASTCIVEGNSCYYCLQTNNVRKYSLIGVEDVSFYLVLSAGVKLLSVCFDLSLFVSTGSANRMTVGGFSCYAAKVGLNGSIDVRNLINGFIVCSIRALGVSYSNKDLFLGVNGGIYLVSLDNDYYDFIAVKGRVFLLNHDSFNVLVGDKFNRNLVNGVLFGYLVEVE